jgi:hypothetical protein
MAVHAFYEFSECPVAAVIRFGSSIEGVISDTLLLSTCVRLISNEILGVIKCVSFNDGVHCKSREGGL